MDGSYSVAEVCVLRETKSAIRLASERRSVCTECSEPDLAVGLLGSEAGLSGETGGLDDAIENNGE